MAKSPQGESTLTSCVGNLVAWGTSSRANFSIGIAVGGGWSGAFPVRHFSPPRGQVMPGRFQKYEIGRCLLSSTFGHRYAGRYLKITYHPGHNHEIPQIVTSGCLKTTADREATTRKGLCRER